MKNRGSEGISLRAGVAKTDLAGHISEQREGDERPDALGTVIPVVSDSLGTANDVPGDSGIPPLVELYHNERFDSESPGEEGKEKEEDSEEDLETIIFPPFPPRLPDPTNPDEDGNNHRATHLVTHQEPEPLERRDEPTRDESEVTLVTRAQSVVVNALRWLFQSFTPFRREAVTSSGHVDGRLTAEMFKVTNPSVPNDLNHPSTSYSESHKSGRAFNPPSTSQDKDPDDDNYFKAPPPAPNDDFK